MTDQPTSIHEMRRRAPLHYVAKTENARFAAYAIATLDQEAQKRCSDQIRYGGDPCLPMSEAFFREAALALELVIKAVIAQRIEVGLAMRHVVRVRPTHDLVVLWAEAELPSLPPADQHHLMIARQGVRHRTGRIARFEARTGNSSPRLRVPIDLGSHGLVQRIDIAAGSFDPNSL